MYRRNRERNALGLSDVTKNKGLVNFSTGFSKKSNNSSQTDLQQTDVQSGRVTQVQRQTRIQNSARNVYDPDLQTRTRSQRRKRDAFTLSISSWNIGDNVSQDVVSYFSDLVADSTVAKVIVVGVQGLGREEARLTQLLRESFGMYNFKDIYQDLVDINNESVCNPPSKIKTFIFADAGSKKLSEIDVFPSHVMCDETGKRGFLHTRIVVEGVPINLVNTHMPFKSDKASVEFYTTMMRALAKYDRELLFVFGDVNSRSLLTKDCYVKDVEACTAMLGGFDFLGKIKKYNPFSQHKPAPVILETPSTRPSHETPSPQKMNPRIQGAKGPRAFFKSARALFNTRREPRQPSGPVAPQKMNPRIQGVKNARAFFNTRHEPQQPSGPVGPVGPVGPTNHRQRIYPRIQAVKDARAFFNTRNEPPRPLPGTPRRQSVPSPYVTTYLGRYPIATPGIQSHRQNNANPRQNTTTPVRRQQNNNTNERLPQARRNNNAPADDSGYCMLKSLLEAAEFDDTVGSGFGEDNNNNNNSSNNDDTNSSCFSNKNLQSTDCTISQSQIDSNYPTMLQVLRSRDLIGNPPCHPVLFKEFNELKIDFLPTYRRNKNTGKFELSKPEKVLGVVKHTAVRGRLPGYADRIFFRDTNNRVKGKSYTSLPIVGNDHLPVSAKFRVRLSD
jgi:hypothetical protein